MSNTTDIKQSFTVAQQAEIDEQKEREIFTKMRDESIRKFKEKFPHGATIEFGEFLT